MKKISIYVAIAAMAVGFTSCAKEGGDNQPASDITVKMSVVNPSSKALTGSEGVHTASFNNGKIYFVDGSSSTAADCMITKVFDIVTEGAEPENGTVRVIAGEEITMPKVPSNSANVYIVANVAADIYSAMPTDGKIGDVLSMSAEVTSLITNSEIENEHNGENVTTIPMYGVGALTPAVVAEEKILEAAVQPTPVGARIEIEKFVNETEAGQYKVNGYKVAGIFIDNYYSKATLTGAVVAANLVENDDEKETYVGGSTVYGSSLEGVVYDYAAAGIGEVSGDDVIAGTDVVWAYNLFAPAVDDYFPNIIVRFTDVMNGEDENIGDRFLTVASFVDSEDKPVSFEPGKIYSIVDFAFKQLDADPYVEDVSAVVTVTAFEWEKVVIKPNGK